MNSMNSWLPSGNFTHFLVKTFLGKLNLKCINSDFQNTTYRIILSFPFSFMWGRGRRLFPFLTLPLASNCRSSFPFRRHYLSKEKYIIKYDNNFLKIKTLENIDMFDILLANNVRIDQIRSKGCLVWYSSTILVLQLYIRTLQNQRYCLRNSLAQYFMV